MSAASFASYVYNKLSGSGALTPGLNDMNSLSRSTSPNPKLTAVWRTKPPKNEDNIPSRSPTFKEDGSLLRLLRTKSMPSLIREKGSPIRQTAPAVLPFSPTAKIDPSASLDQSASSSLASPITSRHLNPRRTLEESDYLESSTNTSIATPPSSPKGLTTSHKKLARSVSDGHIIRRRKQQLRSKAHDFPPVGIMPSVKTLRLRFDTGLEITSQDSSRCTANMGSFSSTSKTVERSYNKMENRNEEPVKTTQSKDEQRKSEEPTQNKKLFRHGSLSRFEPQRKEVEPKPEEIDVSQTSVKRLLKKFESTLHSRNDNEIIHISQRQSRPRKRSVQMKPSPERQSSPTRDQEDEHETKITNGDPEKLFLRQRSKSLPAFSKNIRSSIANIPAVVQKLKMHFEKQSGPAEVPPLNGKMREKEESISTLKEANVCMLPNAAQRGGGDELKKQASLDKVPETKEQGDEYQTSHVNTHDLESPNIETKNQANEKDISKSPSVQNLRKHFESPKSPQLARMTDKRERPVRRRHTIALTVKEFENDANSPGKVSLQPTHSTDADMANDLRPRSSVKSLLKQFELQPPKDKASDLVSSKTQDVSERAITKEESLTPTYVAVKPLAREGSLIRSNASEFLTELKDEDSDEEFYDESGISIKLKAQGSLDYGERGLPMGNTRRGFLKRNYARTESSSDEYSSDHEQISTRIEKDEWRAKKLHDPIDIKRSDRELSDLEKTKRENAERETTEVQKLEELEKITSQREKERIALIQAEQERKALEFERIQKEEEKIRQMREKEEERMAREKADYERRELEKIKQKERERVEQDRREKERAEQESRDKERAEQERKERERLEHIKRERIEQELRERERLERDRREKEKEFERKVQERREFEEKEREKQEQKKIEQEKENQRREFERRENERAEHEEKERKREKAKLEREKYERIEKEKGEIERKEREKADQEKIKKIEQENRIREQAEKERLMRENIEFEGQKRKRQEQEEKERNVREQTKSKKEDQERIAREKIEREHKKMAEEEKERAIQMERDKEIAEKARLQRERETEELSKKHKVGKLVDKFTTLQGMEGEIKIRRDSTKSEDAEQPDFKVGELIEKFVNKKEEKLEKENLEGLQVKKNAPIPTVSAKNVSGKVRNLNADEMRFFNEGGASLDPFVRSQSLRAKKNEPPPFQRGGSLRVKSPEPHPVPGSAQAMPKSCRQLRPDELRFFAMTNNNIYLTKKSANKPSQPQQGFRLRSQDDKGKRPTVSPGDDQGHGENTDSDSDSDTSLLREYDQEDESTDEALMFPEHLDFSTTPYHEDDEDDEAHYSSLTTMDSLIKDDFTQWSSMNFDLSKISAMSKQSMDEMVYLDAFSDGKYEDNDRKNNTMILDAPPHGNACGSVNLEIKFPIENSWILHDEPKTSTPISPTMNIVRTDYGHTNEMTKEDSMGDEDYTDDDIGLLDDAMVDMKDDLEQHQEPLLDSFHQYIQLDVNRSSFPNSEIPDGLQNVLESIDIRASPVDGQALIMTTEGVVDQNYSRESSFEENFEETETKPIEDYFLYIDESKEYLSDQEFGVFCLLVALLSVVIYFIYDFFF